MPNVTVKIFSASLAVLIFSLGAMFLGADVTIQLIGILCLIPSASFTILSARKLWQIESEKALNTSEEETKYS